MTLYNQYDNQKNPNEGLTENLKKAIEILLENQVSDTLILSSYKISTVMENYLGKKYKTEMIGRKLSRLAKKMKLERLDTRIPKYVLNKKDFDGFIDGL